ARRPSVHPDARGNDSTPLIGAWQQRRFIPTRAGTTAKGVGGEMGVAVHPDARRNDGAGSSCGVLRGGSSRRAREQRVGLVSAPVVVTVHPDARGNDVGAVMRRRLASAVHPDARGNDEVLRRGKVEDQRFIPTRAGTTRGADRSSAAQPVHPDARGNDGASETPVVDARGSSGRARERPRLLLHPWYRTRFIPTRAGTTTDAGTSPLNEAVHPDARG